MRLEWRESELIRIQTDPGGAVTNVLLDQLTEGQWRVDEGKGWSAVWPHRDDRVPIRLGATALNKKGDLLEWEWSVPASMSVSNEFGRIPGKETRNAVDPSS